MANKATLWAKESKWLPPSTALGFLMVLACGGARPSGPSDGGGEVDAGSPPDSALTVEVDFDRGLQGWSAAFADYPEGVNWEFDAGLAPLPAPQDQSRHGYVMTGNNHSDDLFMFIKGRVGGLRPSATYSVSIDVELVSAAALECGGVGGAPGEGVFVKAGALMDEPMVTRASDGMVRTTFDKGQQSQGGTDALVLGNVGVPDSACNAPVFRSKRLSSPSPQPVTADANGQVWLVVGSDSGFEATTTLFYTRVVARFSLQRSQGRKRRVRRRYARYPR